MRRPLCFLFVSLLLAMLAAPASAAQWTVPGDFATIQAAIDSPSVQPGDVILVGAGTHAGATVTKAVEIKGEDGATIVSGPQLWMPSSPDRFVGFYFPPGGAGSGATISHLRFEGVPFPVFSRGADDVTVTHNVMIRPWQGVTNWAGPYGTAASFANGWTITHNEILDLHASNGGGVGILVGDYHGGGTSHRPVSDNLIAHNKISGTVFLGDEELGGYNASGVVLYADFRWGYAGGVIAYNRVIKNAIAVASENPGLVDAVALELTDTRDAPAKPAIIHHNEVGFNDFRGSSIQIALTPDWLASANDISRNFGDNRGRGRSPRLLIAPQR